MDDIVKSRSQDCVNVTFYLFAYNQEKYIEKACYAALAQTYSPLEIIFSDDGSVDKTFEIMEAIASKYTGPHHLRLYRNARNFGLIEHVNLAFERAKGELIVAAAGDDVSVSRRVEKIVTAYRESADSAMLLHSSVTMIDNLGKELGIWIPPIISGSLSERDIALSMSIYIGASGAWSRKLYDKFGRIRYKNAYEDLVLGFRALIEGALLYIDEPLVEYNVSSGVVGAYTGIENIDTQSLRGQSPRIATLHNIRRLNLVLAVYSQRLFDLNMIICPSKAFMGWQLRRAIRAARLNIIRANVLYGILIIISKVPFVEWILLVILRLVRRRLIPTIRGR